MSTTRQRSEQASFTALEELLAGQPGWAEVLNRVAYWPEEQDLPRAVAMVEEVANRAWRPEARTPTRRVLDQLRRGEVRPHLRLLRALDVDVPELSVRDRVRVLERMIDEGGVRELHTFRSRVTLGDHVLIEVLGRRVTGLRVLSIGQSQVSSAGAAALAGSPAFAGLHHLSLHSNRIDDRGGLALVASPHLASLRYLNLHANCLGPEVARRMRSRPEWEGAKLVLHGQGS